MLVHRKSYYGEKPTLLTIGHAVATVCSPDTYVDGATERLADGAGNTRDLLGRLVERLYDKGVLDREDVIGVLGHGWVDPTAGGEED